MRMSESYGCLDDMCAVENHNEPSYLIYPVCSLVPLFVVVLFSVSVSISPSSVLSVFVSLFRCHRLMQAECCDCYFG